MSSRVDALVTYYRFVHESRMKDIPILNAALVVEALGFEAGIRSQDDEHSTLEGVLITPWFMSLVRIPDVYVELPNGVGRKFVRAFGSETFEFIGAYDQGIGYHEACALFSPMDGFSSQVQARETAAASLALLRSSSAPSGAHEDIPARRAFLTGRRIASGASY